MKEAFEKIKERVCEFVHERNKSGSAPCKNQRASCLQLIRVCDLTAIINQVEEEYNNDFCKWESDYNWFSGKCKNETSCGYTFYDLNHVEPFKVCPYCGKKIKVVE